MKRLFEYMKETLGQVEEAMDRHLPPAASKPETIHKAMRYSSVGAGKRLRAIMTVAACEIVGGNREEALPAACAIEMIHAYSLVHDDLPAMDDDDMRRGKPSNHKVFGEGMAVLAGDALLTQAFDVLARLPQLSGTSTERTTAVIRRVARAAGTYGLIGGQVADLESEGKPGDTDLLDYIHRHKTGALFKAAICAGGIVGGANEDEIEALATYAEEFGVAFQIIDDILDIQGDEATLGKAVGSDLRQHKLTFPSLYGLERSRQLAQDSVQRAKDALQIFPNKGWILEDLVDYVLVRDH